MYTICHAHQLITALLDQIETFHECKVTGEIGHLPPQHRRLSRIQISPTRIHSLALLASQTSLWVKTLANELTTVAITRTSRYCDTPLSSALESQQSCLPSPFVLLDSVV